jgi:predicted nucleic acid-binding protein
VVLVDTSVWVDHFRKDNSRLRSLLMDGQVLCHPFVIGELACGSLKRRDSILGLLSILPVAPQVQHDEVMHLIASRRLWGKGIGWIDAHLLTATLLSRSTLWTLDRCLGRIAGELKIAAAT